MTTTENLTKCHGHNNDLHTHVPHICTDLCTVNECCSGPEAQAALAIRTAQYEYARFGKVA